MTILLNELTVQEAISNALPFLFGMGILAFSLYVGLIIFFVFVRSQFFYRRMLALVLAFLFVIVALLRIKNDGNEFSMVTAFLFVPFVIGLFTEYLSHKK
ncbi:hypothetical protein HER32_07875 [Hymenobacter sp. BT18]|uniref:hypothetical protein n=1 Tax=Hymenobacter sp. BT18 TaxID=2835648 RepID=UPI00143E3A3D|nr:hypothetical protein [Hymenobacter sp. BT18]QIX61105.1 hypothetical protein HER32_07875 [Hymenobacter sp. BT18]